MPSRRTAATKARAAITGASTRRGGSATAASNAASQAEVPSKKRKIEYTPSILDTLPSELLEMVIDAIPDAYTVLNLALVSKNLYTRLCVGKEADAHWKRRCKAISQKRRFSVDGIYLKDWLNSYISTLRTRCAICADPKAYSYVIGQLVPRVPNWLRVCHDCECLEGPLQAVAWMDVRTMIPEEERHLVPSYEGVTTHAHFLAWFNEHEQRKTAIIKDLISTYSSEQIPTQLLRNIFDSLTLPPTPDWLEGKLHKLVRVAIKNGKPSQVDIDAIVARYQKVETTRKEVEKAFERIDYSPVEGLELSPDASPSRWSPDYLDDLVDGKITLEEYMEETMVALEGILIFE